MFSRGYTELSIDSRSYAASEPTSSTPFGEPDTVPVPPAGCSGCLQDNGTKMLSWKYVGEGHGTFQPRQSYDYVGQGRGSYEKEVIVTPGRLNLLKVAMCFCVPLTLLLIGFALASMLGVSGSFPSLPSLPGIGPLSNQRLASVSFNCNEGLDIWPSNWTTLKKEWCCTEYEVGCLPAMVGCNTQCEYFQKTATCAYRIQWGANHKFAGQPAACEKAHQMVASQCPWCGSQCPLAQANCMEVIFDPAAR